MKSPDDTAARFARLRRLIVESFEAGDFETWAAATEEMRRELRLAGVPPPQRGKRKDLKKVETP